MNQKQEGWGTRIGVILAVTGSAVGLGNFLRFPGQAAKYGGAFMIPYVVAFLIVGLPLAWAEWALGRYGGAKGHNSVPGIFRSITKTKGGAYFGLLGTLMPVMIYMYYVFVEAWCLAYAWDFLVGIIPRMGADAGAIGNYFANSVGVAEHGAILGGSASRMLIFLVICFMVNFSLIYRGVNKGIEKFCNIAMPMLVVCAIVVLIRVLTLPPNPAHPEQNLINGMGYMWNPTKKIPVVKKLTTEEQEAAAAAAKQKDSVDGVTKALADARMALEAAKTQSSEIKGMADPAEIDQALAAIGTVNKAALAALPTVPQPGKSEAPKMREQSLVEALANPDIWLAATGQIFFSLSVGFGLILTYASYLKKNDDVALSSLTAAAGNGFCEVVLGGMVAIPAAFIFLGPSVVQNPPGTFGMGFITLPNVFNQMPMGRWVGFLFFFLLFLAAVTSSLSMLQPSIALLEEAWGVGRRASVTVLGFITLTGAMFVVYFSKGFAALDTIDWWMANFFIFIMATVQIIIFGWVIGADKGMDELQRGAAIKLPRVLKVVMKYLAPIYLLAVFGYWCKENLADRLKAIVTIPDKGLPIVQMSLGLIAIVALFFGLVVMEANRRWDKEEKEETE